MWQYMLDENHFYDLRDLPVGNWNAAKLQMTKNSIWMHFHEPNSKKFYNSTNPIDFKKQYIPPSRPKKVTSKSTSINSLSQLNKNSPIYVCDNDSFAVTNDNLQIMNEEDAYNNPKPIIPVVGQYGQKITPKKTRSKHDHRSLKELASIPTTCRSVRTVRALSTTPTSVTRKTTSRSNPRFEELSKQKNLVHKNSNVKQNSKSTLNQNLYFSLKKEIDSSKTETSLSNSNTDTESTQKSNLEIKEESTDKSSEIDKLNSSPDSKDTTNSNPNLKLDLTNTEIDDEINQKAEQFVFVHSSQEDREAAQAKRTLQMLERKERKYEPGIPSFTICGDTTVISNTYDIDPNISTKKAVIFSDELPNPPLYIDKRYGDNCHKNPNRISQIEIRKQFKEALDNGELDDYDLEYEYEIIEEIENEGNEEYTNTNDNEFYSSRSNKSRRDRNHNRIRNKRNTINTRRNLYKTRVNYMNEDKNDKSSDTPMLTRKQYFNSASKIPNIGSLAYDL